MLVAAAMMHVIRSASVSSPQVGEQHPCAHEGLRGCMLHSTGDRHNSSLFGSAHVPIGRLDVSPSPARLVQLTWSSSRTVLVVPM